MASGIAVQFFEITVGAIVVYGATRYKVTHLISVDTVLAVDLTSGETCRLPIEQLRLEPNEEEQASAAQEHVPRDLSLYSADEWREAQRRFDAIKGLLNDPFRTREEAKALAEQAGVHVATLYRWLHEYLRVGNVSALVPARRGRKTGTRLLSVEVEAIVDSVIEAFYLDKQRHTPHDTIEEIQARCRLAKLEAPHPNTIRNRIRQIPEIVRLKRRGRREEATNRFTPIKGTIENATHPFAVVQIDHTPMDIIVVDEVYRQPIGRPYLTLAIDVFSRMVAGIYISLAPPSSASVALCLANAICPKREYLASLGVSGSWPVWGKPAVVHVDNAEEFRGLALERGAAQHGIDLQFRPPATPNYGGHIERLIGTTMRWVHKMPGTTFSNPSQRKGYDSEAEAALTMKELELEVVDFFVNRYHQRPHTKLGVPPIKKWERGIVGTDEEPGLGLMPVPDDPHRLLIDFMPMITRTVQRYGIQWDNITYYDPVLDPFINAADADDERRKQKFVVRRDPRDISRVYFYNPDAAAYTPLPYRNISHSAMSLFELMEIRKRLTEEGHRDIDEGLIFEHLERFRRRVAEAVHKSKKARKAQARGPVDARPVVASIPSARGGSTPVPVPVQPGSNDRSQPSAPLPSESAVEEDIFAAPIRPFDNLGMRQ
ncbi:Mu transposase C-terminal domain-containing protein [Derxia gummosa]|uniref:Mu transposase C-terminal domain-containing protein n=1 Tax=Derxia gummosa DSM 723 TaxID=1121388 RepID=A0A8B6X7F8_9BURK|nr:Mu transposase C-terminal domain-containing protein [Derxia gummosa]